MKWMLLALALSSTVGCMVPNDSTIRVLAAHALKAGGETDKCEAEEIQLLAGSLDISAGVDYFIQFDLESDFQQINTTTGSQVIADDSRNIFFGEEVIFTYTSTPALVFEQESQPLHFVVKPNAAGLVRLGLITRKADAVLFQNVKVPEDPLDLRVQLEFRGKLASGQSVRSNSIVYPIVVFTSNFPGCQTGQLRVGNGPCGGSGGQDGHPVLCCDPDPTDATKCK